MNGVYLSSFSLNKRFKDVLYFMGLFKVQSLDFTEQFYSLWLRFHSFKLHIYKFLAFLFLEVFSFIVFVPT